jgi:hypothetical protein
LTAPTTELEGIAQRHFSLSALRRRRLERRNEAIRRLAVELFAAGKATKGCALASLIAGLLRRRARDVMTARTSRRVSCKNPGRRSAVQISGAADRHPKTSRRGRPVSSRSEARFSRAATVAVTIPPVSVCPRGVAGSSDDEQLVVLLLVAGVLE